MNSYFLWPNSAPYRKRCFVGSKIGASEIESTLARLFPDSVPVLYSSARAGLAAILQLLKLSRPDIVWCPPFSSHCVLEAISRFATPSMIDSPEAKAALIYHQWGFVHEHGFQSGITIIEDAADTFFLPGTTPFAADGRFVLWSLPKAISTIWGGVVFCRNDEDAHYLRIIRTERGDFMRFQAILRLMSDRFTVAENYWSGCESMSGGLPAFALRHIKAQLANIQSLTKQRMHRLDVIRSSDIHFPLVQGRLPSNIPIEPPEMFEKWWGPERLLSAGLRSMNLDLNYTKNAWRRVAPLPVHQDISESIYYSLPIEQFMGALK